MIEQIKYLLWKLLIVSSVWIVWTEQSLTEIFLAEQADLKVAVFAPAEEASNLKYSKPAGPDR